MSFLQDLLEFALQFSHFLFALWIIINVGRNLWIHWNQTSRLDLVVIRTAWESFLATAVVLVLVYVVKFLSTTLGWLYNEYDEYLAGSGSNAVEAGK